MKSIRHLSTCCVLLFLPLLSGCGGPLTHPVHGKVVFAGSQQAARELVSHTVTIETIGVEPGVSGIGVVTENGTFEIGTYDLDDGAVPGKHRVTLTPPLPPVDGPEPPQLIHSRHFAFETSGWEITIESGVNEVSLQVDRPSE